MICLYLNPAKALANIVLLLLLSSSLYGQTQQQANPLTRPKDSVGVIPAQQPKDIRALTQPSPPVVPNEFNEGQLSERVETFGYRIMRLEDDMRSVLGTIGFFKGAAYVLGGLLGGLGIFGGLILKKWWKPIVKSLVRDSYTD